MHVAIAAINLFAQTGAEATSTSAPQPPAEELFEIFGLPVTNSIFTAWVVIAILVLFVYFSTRNMQMIPKGVQNFSRPLSLAFRLFGNIFAGEVLLATMLNVAPYVMFVFIGLELFVGLIQALIFSMLSLVFLSIATVHLDAHGEHAENDSLEGE